MPRLPQGLPAGTDQPINVGVQRDSVNLKESLNVAEQAKAAVRTQPSPVFAKHGTYWNTPHPISSAWDKR